MRPRLEEEREDVALPATRELRNGAVEGQGTARRVERPCRDHRAASPAISDGVSAVRVPFSFSISFFRCVLLL